MAPEGRQEVVHTKNRMTSRVDFRIEEASNRVLGEFALQARSGGSRQDFLERLTIDYQLEPNGGIQGYIREVERNETMQRDSS